MQIFPLHPFRPVGDIPALRQQVRDLLRLRQRGAGRALLLEQCVLVAQALQHLGNGLRSLLFRLVGACLAALRDDRAQLRERQQPNG